MSNSGIERKDNNPVVADIREAVQSIRAAILKSQARAAQMVNHEQLSLYYGIGAISPNTRVKAIGVQALLAESASS